VTSRRASVIEAVVLLAAASLAHAGLSATAETIALPRVMPSFNQAYTLGPGAWGDCTLGTGGCPDLLRATGCLITAFSAVLAYYEMEFVIPAAFSSTGTPGAGMNPRILNDWLRARRGYGECAGDPVGACCLEWGDLPRGVTLSFHSNRSSSGLNPVAALVIDHALRSGHPVVAGVHWSATCRQGSSQTEDCHWVVLTGKTGSTYMIVDPYNPDHTNPAGVRTTLDAGSLGAYTIDRFVIVTRTPGDQSPLNALPSPAAAPDVPPAATPAPQQADTTASVIVLLLALSIVAAAIFFSSGTAP
jgi:hypothetical protein